MLKLKKIKPSFSVTFSGLLKGVEEPITMLKKRNKETQIVVTGIYFDKNVTTTETLLI